MASASKYLYSHLIFTPPYPKTKFTGQIVIVTGSNVGLGLEAARHFVRLDAQKVILAVRTLEKGEAAKESILKSEKKTADVVEVWKLDLSSYQSCKDFAKRAQELPRIDILVENAGMVTEEWKMTEDNESTITTNVVSPVLHALLLLPKLRETSLKYNTVPRLVFVTSFVHWHTKFEEQKEEKIFEALADKSKANMANT
jgi:retinol dehydrogenase-12